MAKKKKKLIEPHWQTPVPEWCRIQYNSALIREVWGPRIAAISREFQAVEMQTVASGIRRGALQTVNPVELAELAPKCAERGLMMVPFQATGTSGGYTSGAVEGNDSLRVLVTRRGDVEAVPTFLEAWENDDQKTVGEILGFPACCSSFFQHTWVTQGWRDTSWPMTGAVAGAKYALATGEADLGNILLRWLGVRYISHLPCSLDCEKTREVAKIYRDIYDPVIREWADELLESSIEWSAVNGIALIKTPLFTISAKTDSMAHKKTIQLKGRSPAGSPVGLHFPYGYLPAAEIENTWTDNGFDSELNMIKAHNDTLLWLRTRGLNALRVVIDIGCGNGVLLKRVPCQKRVGVERDQVRATKAQKRGIEILEHELKDVRSLPQNDATLLMPGRLLEVDNETANRIVGLLVDTTRNLIVYTYDKPDGGLAGLVEKTPLAQLNNAQLAWHVKTDHVEIGLLKWDDPATTN